MHQMRPTKDWVAKFKLRLTSASIVLRASVLVGRLVQWADVPKLLDELVNYMLVWRWWPSPFAGLSCRGCCPIGSSKIYFFSSLLFDAPNTMWSNNQRSNLSTRRGCILYSNFRRKAIQKTKKRGGHKANPETNI